MNFGLQQLLQQSMAPPAPQPAAPQTAGIHNLLPRMPGEAMNAMIAQGVERLNRDAMMQEMQRQGVAEMQSPNFIQAPPSPSPAAQPQSGSPYIDPRMIPQAVDSAAAVARSGVPSRSVNADLGRTPDAYYHNPANFANDRMQGIALDRRDANADRVRRLSDQGLGMDEVERMMYPERFGDLRAQAAQSVADRRGSGTAFNEAQGRVSADARALKLMRMAGSQGQTLPFALAYQMAQTSMPTTSDATAGNPSLPAVDITRMAGLGPAAAAAAGQTQIGLGQNENVSGRNQMDFANEQGRQGLARDAMGSSNQMAMLEMLRKVLGDQHTQRNENRVLDDTLGDPSQKSRQAALAWLNSDAARDAGNSLNPEVRNLHSQMLKQASGAGSNYGVGQYQSGSDQITSQDLVRQREQLIASDPAAMAQHLASFSDPLTKLREQARIYAANGRGSDPVVRDYLIQSIEKDDPNLSIGPDWIHDSYNSATEPGLISKLFGVKSQAQKAAERAEQHYGIPANVALPHYGSYYDR